MPADLQTNPEELVTLLNAATAFEANVIAAALHDAGIEATALTTEADLETPLSLAREKPVAPVLVRKADLERARTHLEVFQEGAAEIDWSQVADTQEGSVLAEAQGGLRWARRGFLLLVLAALSLAIWWIVAGLA